MASGLVLAAATVALTAACSSSTAQGGPELPAPTAEQKAEWALPLDAYIDDPVTSTLTGYAENLLISDCMSTKGRDWPVSHIDVSQLGVRTTSPSGRKILTVKIATNYGYHRGLMVSKAAYEKSMDLNSRALDAGTQSDLDSCIRTARKSLPLPDYSQLGTRLANDALKSAGGDAVVEVAARKWQECMRPEGIADLPDAPDGASDETMPTPTQSEKFDLGDPLSKPSTAELRAAVADARCRASSGYSDALYAAEWKYQASALAKNVDQLERDRDALGSYATKAKSVIAEHPGA